MGCGLDHLAFEKKFSSLDVLYRDKDYFLTFLEKSLKTGITCSSFHNIFDTGIVWQRFFSSEILGVFLALKL